MFVDMAANQTRLGSATSAGLLLHIRELSLPMERRIPDHWNPFDVMIVFQMFGLISNTRWGEGGDGNFQLFLHMKDMKPPGMRFVSLLC